MELDWLVSMMLIHLTSVGNPQVEKGQRIATSGKAQPWPPSTCVTKTSIYNRDSAVRLL